MAHLNGTHMISNSCHQINYTIPPNNAVSFVAAATTQRQVRLTFEGGLWHMGLWDSTTSIPLVPGREEVGWIQTHTFNSILPFKPQCPAITLLEAGITSVPGERIQLSQRIRRSRAREMREVCNRPKLSRILQAHKTQSKLIDRLPNLLDRGSQ